MKKSITLLIILLFIFQLTYSEQLLAKVEFSQELFEKLAKNNNKVPQIDIPEYKRIELVNGVIVYLVEDHQLPIIEMTGYIAGGRRQEELELAGISTFMFEMMNTGTKKFNERELSNYKDINGIDFAFRVYNDYVSFGGSALSTETEEFIALVAEILENPKFNAQHFTRVKQEIYRGLAQAKTQESSLLNMYFYKNIYKNHPYSFASDIDLRLENLSNISPENLEEFYEKNIAPNNTIIAIVGDIDSKQMEEMINEYFIEWGKVEDKDEELADKEEISEVVKNSEVQKDELDNLEEEDKVDKKESDKEQEIEYKNMEIQLKKPVIKIDEQNYGKVILVNKADATQAKIKMGYNFFGDEFKEQVAFTMANRVYGGGDFESRLMDNLRTDKGYVYGIGANDSYNELGGVYYISTEVKPDKSFVVIEEIKKEMLAIKAGDKKIIQQELFEIVNLYNAFFPKAYDSKLRIISETIYNLELKAKKEDTISQFIKDYNKLTANKVQKVFSKYTYPDRFLTVIVGNKDDILPQFQEQEIEVEVID